MKTLSLILAVFTFTLSLFPCDDELLISTVGDIEITNSDHNGHPCERGVDYCTPFCVCAITIVEDYTSETFTVPVIKKFKTVNFLYLAPFSIGISTSIFQPPKA